MSNSDSLDSICTLNDRNFEQIWTKMCIDISQPILSSFISQVYKTLSYENVNGFLASDSFAITNILNLPYPIGVRIFNVLKTKKNCDFILAEDFQKLFSLIFFGNIEEKKDFFFKIIDFDNDDNISKKDVRIFFKHLNFKQHIKENRSTNEIINAFFNLKTKMNFEEYKTRASENSDIILLFFFSVFKNKLIDSDLLQFYEKNVIENRESTTLRKTASTNNVMSRKQYSYHSVEKNNYQGNENQSSKNTTILSLQSLHTSPSSKKKDKCKSDFNLFQKTKYAPTSKLFDLLNEKFNLKLSYYSPKPSLDTKDDDLDDENELDALCSFENDVQASFNSLKKTHFLFSNHKTAETSPTKCYPYRSKNAINPSLALKGKSFNEISKSELSLLSINTNNQEFKSLITFVFLT